MFVLGSVWHHWGSKVIDIISNTRLTMVFGEDRFIPSINTDTGLSLFLFNKSVKGILH